MFLARLQRETAHFVGADTMVGTGVDCEVVPALTVCVATTLAVAVAMTTAIKSRRR